MSDYVDREAALKAIAEDKIEMTPELIAIGRAIGTYTAEQAFDGINQACDRHIESIKILSAADVQPVKHGRWIQDEHTYSGCWTYNYVCSACGEIGGSWLRNIRRDQMFPYCPFCGAKMDEEDDND